MIKPAELVIKFLKIDIPDSLPRRLSDWLEKMSVAAFALGMFQDKPDGLPLSIEALALSMIISLQLQWKVKKKEGEKMTGYLLAGIIVAVAGILGIYAASRSHN